MAQINSGWTYEPSGVKSEVTAENLNAHVNNASLAVGAIKEQDSSLLSSDSDEMLQAQGSTLVRLTKANFTKNINSTNIVTDTLDANSITTDSLSVGGKPINGDSLTPVGSVLAYIALTAPVGWLVCDGQSLNAITNTQYETLWNLIGLTFGGTGKADFKVPDLRGEFIRGWSNGRTEGSPAVDVDSGRVFGSKQNDLLKKHKHNSSNSDCQNYADYVHGVSNGQRFNTFCDSNGVNWNGAAPLTGDGTHGDQTGTYAGAPTSVGVVGEETRPRNIALNYIIKF